MCRRYSESLIDQKITMNGTTARRVAAGIKMPVSTFYAKKNEPETFSIEQMVSSDRDEVLVSVVTVRPRPNLGPLCIKLKGLEPDGIYETVRTEVFGSPVLRGVSDNTEKRRFTGVALMYGGLVLPFLFGDYVGVQICLRRTEQSVLV